MERDDAPETVVNQVIDAFNRHDAEAVGACYTEDAVVHDPGSPEPLKGREAIIAFDTVIFGAFSDVRFEPLAPVIVSGISLEQAVVSTLYDDGLIVEERAYFDATGFAMKLGLVG